MILSGSFCSRDGLQTYSNLRPKGLFVMQMSTGLQKRGAEQTKIVSHSNKQQKEKMQTLSDATTPILQHIALLTLKNSYIV